MSGSSPPRFEYGDHTVALRPDSNPKDVAVAIDGTRQQIGSVVVSLRAHDRLPDRLVEAAASELGDSNNALLYVLGDATDLSPEVLLPFQKIKHLNLNVRNLGTWQFLSQFTALHTLMIQNSPKGTAPLTVLDGMNELSRLSIPAAVKEPDALGRCSQLRYLHCSSSKPVIDALAGHPALEFLDIAFGTNRDLQALARIRSLIGVAIYQIRSLTGDDLVPIGQCQGLRALSLGALRNVSHLSALRAKPRYTLQALLIEDLPSLGSLSDVAACERLERLGLYGSRPKDKSLQPLAQLKNLTHLVLGDPYPASEITALTSWYSGAVRYRDKISRGAPGPAWRTPIDRLAPQPPAT